VKRRSVVACAVATAGTLAIAPLARKAEAAAPAAPGEAAGVALARPDLIGAVTLEQALARRRSVRRYSARPVSLADALQLLWAAQGETSADGKRTAPSAGALYPLELHLVASRVEGLAPGVYRYVPATHKLRGSVGEPIARALVQAANDQQAVAEAAAVVVIAAVEERTARTYSVRASRYVAFEAGAASQNLALQAAALGLATVVLGAFDDAAVGAVLRLAPGERALALMPVGRPV